MLGLLGAFVLLPLLPALTLQVPVLHNDVANELLPRAMAMARGLQAGAIPLWDFNTFAGARPFYVNEMASLYAPMLPFSLLANPDDARQASVMLVLLPYALHVLWAALGAYLFGRLAMLLHPAGAFTVGLAYALCPEIACGFTSLQEAFLFCHLPWVMLAVARFMESGRTSWWCAGSVALAVLGSTGVDNFTIRVYFITAVTVTLLWLFFVLGVARRPAVEGGAAGTWPRMRALSLPRLLAAVAMFVVSAGLHGMGWLSLLESAGWMQASLPMTPELASGMTPESSMPPLYLTTLFLPGFYGVLDIHGWGVVLEEKVNTLSAVSGGMFVMTAVLTALLALRCRPGQGDDHRQRMWTWIGLLMLVGSLFTMMGRFTPVFGWFCAVLPWFFKFPHPVYYRFAACWSVALLAGLGVSALITSPAVAGSGSAPRPSPEEARLRQKRSTGSVAGPVPGLPWYGRWPVAALCVALALGGTAVGLWWRVDSLRGYQALSLYGEWRWFLTRPALQLAAASIALLAIFTRLAPHRRGWALAVGVAAETVLLAAYIVYVAPLADQDRKPPDYRVHWLDDEATQRRCRTLADFVPYRAVAAVRPLQEHPPVRVATYTSAVDNQAWATDGRALLGYAAKPLLPRFERAIEPFVTGLPYDLALNDVSVAFMCNMNVGYLIAAEKPSVPWPVVARLESAVVYQLETPLPWVYTQDRIVAADDARQLEVLQNGELREAVLVAPEVAARLPTCGASDLAAFAALQATNRILRVDRSHPNRLTIEADMARPAMLVIVECWHPGWSAKVDGRTVPVWQVNYLQQGLWLDAGRHRVELAFMPESVRRGVAVSGASGAVFLLVAGVGLVRERRRLKPPAVGNGNGQNGPNGASP
ncbi:MAG: YfhO family protein [Lentisphaerae bacterium]|nr:YfhO family protein [Lentisphaerota bacterium]